MSWLKNNIKKCISVLLMLMVMASLCACGDELPEMTDEEMALITDYASALLLKYDSGAPSRLLPEGEVDLTIVFNDPPENNAAGKEELSISGDISTEQSSSNATVNDSTSPENSSHAPGFDEFLTGMGFNIKYAGNTEVVDSYPTENSNAYFTTDASAGHKLLVMHFDLTNTSGGDLDVNLNTLDLRYRVSLDDGRNKNVMTTLLSNDLLSYKGTVEANGSVDLVAVAEITEDEVNFSTLTFTIRGDDFSTSQVLE